MAEAVKEKLDARAASVSAHTLYRLAPFLAKRDECFFRGGGVANLWGWRVEPCAAGGVLVVATDGVSAGVIHDPEGRASEPVTIMASEGLLKAITPPPPVTVHYPGDFDEIPLPDDFQPGQVVAMAIFVAVYDKGIDKRAPDEPGGEHYALYTESAEDGRIYAGGYRLEREFVDWRGAFDRWVEDDVQPCHQRLAPPAFNAFHRICRGVLDLYGPTDPERPVLVRAVDAPEFVGLVMRGDCSKKPASPPSLPDWLTSVAAAAEGGAA